MSSKKKNKLKQEQNAQAVKGKQKSFLSSVKTNISKKDFSKEIKVLIVFGLFAVSGFFGFAFSGAPTFFSIDDTRAASAVSLYSVTPKTVATPTVSAHIYFFGREDCAFCKAEKKFLSGYIPANPEVSVQYFDIVNDPKAKSEFTKITSLNNLPQVTPLALVGGKVIQVYAGDETTGKEIIDAVTSAKAGKDVPLSFYENKALVATSASGCDANGKECGIKGPEKPSLVYNVPFIGKTDLKDFSLFSLSAILGFIDGFNPCAMWVLITFLIALIQVGSRKRMFYVAGLFLLAEAIQYYLILTLWYKLWDFVGLDQIVTPLVGLLSLGSGIFFLYRWTKAKDTFTCDITDIDEQEKIGGRIQKLANAPLTIFTTLGIIGLALSVNIIEFACSIGIPQVFTKTLELNQPSFWAYQGYMFTYMFGYMADDIVVFAFALYGINKIHSSEKYSKWSLLIGGVLMLLLGVLLAFFPNILVL